MKRKKKTFELKRVSHFSHIINISYLKIFLPSLTASSTEMLSPQDLSHRNRRFVGSASPLLSYFVFEVEVLFFLSFFSFQTANMLEDG